MLYDGIPIGEVNRRLGRGPFGEPLGTALPTSVPTPEEIVKLREKFGLSGKVSSDPSVHDPSALQRIKSGAIGVGKAILGIDRADGATIAYRKSVCKGCPRFRGSLCLECGCALAMKQVVKSERCPIGKWIL